MTSSLFHHLETLQNGEPWGSLLDAGSGVNSSRWISGLQTDRWTLVTAAGGHADQIRKTVQGVQRPQDRLVLGNWMDPGLLSGEVFDVVLADYLIGAVEGFGPYFQTHLIRRLKPLVRRRLYIIGLDPYVVGDAPDEAARLVRDIGRVRDACLSMAGETPYREYPAEWVLDQLDLAGFTVVTAQRFANRYKAKWINGQLDMGLRRLPKVPDRALASALEGRIETLRGQALDLARRDGALRHGFDYVIAAEPKA